MGWGGVGWGAITFLALHPRLGQHGGGGGVGWGAITFLAHHFHLLAQLGGLGWGGEERLRRLYEISQSVFPVPTSTPFRLSH